METDTHFPDRPTPDEARAALADAACVQESTAARSATPWPLWFATVITAYVALFPVAYGGMLSDRDWLLPTPAWTATLAVSTLVYLALFAYAGRAWRRRTGVALRFDVLPKTVTVPLVTGLPLLLVGSAWAFKLTGRSAWIVAASALAAAVSVGFHLAFVRLHRKAGAR
ncbi:hypothetical protein [Streptomyces luteolus]|uniref:Uncharacterized protein n=1 Tax=Streptomyces luteolus TaxID=3043615 RepID=A0ABT6T2A6_9ACTN|nr:hypothetical protein [Streptomyces sp. B-S-A12]MDI3422001.1 hypothetical protein [Streptomyces sp. B-S-A12]